MSNDRLGEKLKALRMQKGKTLNEVALYLGINKSTLLRWESGETEKIKREYISSLLTYYNVPASFLYPDKDDIIDLKSDVLSYDVSEEYITEGKISAGLPKFMEASDTFGDSERLSRNSDEYFYLRVKGDSMNKLNILNGSLVLIRKQNDVENGAIAAVRVGDDEATLKLFYHDKDTVFLVPMSDNPIYKPQIYNLKETNIEVMGKAIECKFKL